MLIIEGCDQAGKTTLAKECVKVLRDDYELPMMYGHLDKPAMNWDKYWDYRALTWRHVVMDRFHMSHIAYRAIDKEPHDLTPLTYSMVDAEITLQGGLVVVLLPTNTLIKSRWNAMPAERSEMYDHDHVLRVNEVFHEIACAEDSWRGYRVKIDMVFLDDDLGNFPDTVESICERYAEQQREHDRIFQRRPPGHVR